MLHEPPPDPFDPSASSALLLELKQVLDAIRSVPERCGTAPCRLALVRLVDSIDLETWRSISARHGLEQWLALPLGDSQAETLQDFQERLEELLYQRDHDSLTGLANRRFFDRQLHMELERAHRMQNDLSLVMLDLDDFKRVNDTYGHAMGDQVLMRLGAQLKNCLRTYDVAARIGGEEFCLILPGASSLRAQALAKRVLEGFRNERFSAPEGRSFAVTFSAGVATAPSHLERIDATALVAQADEALYRAKHRGKDQVCVRQDVLSFSENPALVHVAEKKFLFSGSA